MNLDTQEELAAAIALSLGNGADALVLETKAESLAVRAGTGLESEPQALSLGGAATIHGLRGAPQHNGKRVKLLGFDAARGRLGCNNARVRIIPKYSSNYSLMQSCNNNTVLHVLYYICALFDGPRAAQPRRPLGGGD